MNKGDGLRFMIKSRGLTKGFKRLAYICRRFGFAPDKFLKCVQRYSDILKTNGVKGSFFIPSEILGKYLDPIKRLDTQCIEWGIHCDVHTDLSRFGLEEQKKHIIHAVESFKRMGIPFYGFRAPYLKTNSETLSALRQSGAFLYDSSSTVVWDEYYKAGSASFRWVQDFYGPQLHTDKPSVPVTDSGFVQIPVSLPEDDMLIDRDNLKPDAVYAVWTDIMRHCHRTNEVFVLQLHPERIFELGEVLSDLIKSAKALKPPMLVESLGDVALRYKNGYQADITARDHRGIFCISGDIDSCTLWDFVSRIATW